MLQLNTYFSSLDDGNIFFNGNNKTQKVAVNRPIQLPLAPPCGWISHYGLGLEV